MDKITIYQREYTLPSLANERFQQLQHAIRERQQMLKQGQRMVHGYEAEEIAVPETPSSGGRWQKWFKKQPSAPQTRTVRREVTNYTRLNIEEHFEETRKLVQDYETMLGMLTRHKAEYDRLLGQMAEDIRSLAAERSQKILAAEAKRTELEARAVQSNDEATLTWIRTQRDQLLRSVRLLGQAAILIVKKIDLFRQGLERFSEDQVLQKQALDSVMGKMRLRYEAYQLQKQINQIEREVAEMAQVAVNFEELMRECFGPFQQVIDEVIAIDDTFAGTLAEIKSLTDLIRQEQTGAAALAEEQDELLEFLIRSHLKQERLTEVLEQAHRSSWDADFEAELATGGADEISVSQALENIRALLAVRLPPPAADAPELEPWQPSAVQLRREPQTISDEDCRRVFGLNEAWRPLEYIRNDFEVQGDVVLDRATGLTWQRSGSPELITYQQAQAYIRQLNDNQFGGYADWRLPTIPELMSLLEPGKQSNDLYISPVFGKNQTWCWSSDKRSSSSAWHVYFLNGLVYWSTMDGLYYVRVVHS